MSDTIDLEPLKAWLKLAEVATDSTRPCVAVHQNTDGSFAVNARGSAAAVELALCTLLATLAPTFIKDAELEAAGATDRANALMFYLSQRMGKPEPAPTPELIPLTTLH